MEENNSSNKSAIIMFVMFAMFIVGIILANSLNDWCKVTDVKYRAELLNDPEYPGAILVTETITVDVHAATNTDDGLYWELWRDLIETETDGVTVKYDVLSVTEISNGRRIPYERSSFLFWDDSDYNRVQYYYHDEGPYDPINDTGECVMIYPGGVYREIMTFEIQYIMYDAVLRYEDCSDLYVCMYSEDTVNTFESFEAEFLIPNDMMPDDDNYEVYTYGTTELDFDYDESSTRNPGYHTIYFELDEDDLKFNNSTEYIEIEIISKNEDRHSIAPYASRNDFYNDEAYDDIIEEMEDYYATGHRNDVLRVLRVVGVVALCGLLVLYVLMSYKIFKKKYKMCDSSEKYDAMRENLDEIDPYFAYTLYNSKRDIKELKDGPLMALLMSLVRKNKITITDTRSLTIAFNDYRFVAHKRKGIGGRPLTYEEILEAKRILGIEDSIRPLTTYEINRYLDYKGIEMSDDAEVAMPELVEGAATNREDAIIKYNRNLVEKPLKYSEEKEAREILGITSRRALTQAEKYEYLEYKYNQEKQEMANSAPSAATTEASNAEAMAQATSGTDDTTFAISSTPNVDAFANTGTLDFGSISENTGISESTETLEATEALEATETLETAETTEETEPVEEIPLTKCEEVFLNFLKKIAYNGALGTYEAKVSWRYIEDRINDNYSLAYNLVKELDNAAKLYGVEEGYFAQYDYEKPKKTMDMLSKVIGVVTILVVVLSIVYVVNNIHFNILSDVTFWLYGIASATGIFAAFKLKSISNKCLMLTQKGADSLSVMESFYKYICFPDSLASFSASSEELKEKAAILAAALDMPTRATDKMKLSEEEEARYSTNDSTYDSTIHHGNWRRMYSTGAHSNIRLRTHTFGHNVRSGVRGIRSGYSSAHAMSAARGGGGFGGGH